MKAPLFVRNH